MIMLLQIIALSASANKLSKIKERADEYTALIMEELDPTNLGYIEVCPIPSIKVILCTTYDLTALIILTDGGLGSTIASVTI